MKRIIKKKILSLLLYSGLLSSCVVMPEYTPKANSEVASKIELVSNSVTLYVNSTYTISYTYDVENSNEIIYWKPMDTSIVTISQSGTIQASDKIGKTKILLTSVNTQRKDNLETSIEVQVVSMEDFFMTNEDNELNGILDKNITSISLPEKLNNRDVTTIAADAFKGCKKLTTLTIPNGYEYLKDHCFDGLSELTNLLLPATLKYIGPSYGYLKKLKKVYFDSVDRFRNIDSTYRVAESGNYLYQQGLIYHDGKTQTVREYAKLIAAWYDFNLIPDYVDETKTLAIEELASGCLYSLDTIRKGLELPKAIRKIEYNFMGYSTINQIILPNNIESIEPGAFANATRLESITSSSYTSNSPNASGILIVDNGVYKVDSTENNITLLAGCNGTIMRSCNEIAQYCFEGCNFGKGNFIIYNGVSKIGKGAFKNNPRLLSILIPDSVTNVEEEITNGILRNIDDEGNLKVDIPSSIGPFYMCENATLRVTFNNGSQYTPAGFCSSWASGVKNVEYNQVF